MPSKQFEHLAEKSLADIRQAAFGLPLVVVRSAKGFCVLYDGKPACEGRYQLVLTFINGFGTGWVAHAGRPVAKLEDQLRGLTTMKKTAAGVPLSGGLPYKGLDDK